jgi:hypothetical protein
MLRRYWLELATTRTPSALNLGCGITAYDEADARRIFEDRVVTVFGSRAIMAMMADIDVSTLDQGHIRANMGDPSSRGVWFPLL